jgi:hypothetical protein
MTVDELAKKIYYTYHAQYQSLLLWENTTNESKLLWLKLAQTAFDYLCLPKLTTCQQEMNLKRVSFWHEILRDAIHHIERRGEAQPYRPTPKQVIAEAVQYADDVLEAVIKRWGN